jgi:hypothetical protein
VSLIVGLQDQPVHTISKGIAEEARYCGKKKEGRTPFADRAQEHGYQFEGGKVN